MEPMATPRRIARRCALLPTLLIAPCPPYYSPPTLIALRRPRVHALPRLPVTAELTCVRGHTRRYRGAGAPESRLQPPKHPHLCTHALSFMHQALYRAPAHRHVLPCRGVPDNDLGPGAQRPGECQGEGPSRSGHAPHFFIQRGESAQDCGLPVRGGGRPSATAVGASSGGPIREGFVCFERDESIRRACKVQPYQIIKRG